MSNALGCVPVKLKGALLVAQNAIEEMCKHVQKPLVFPLSNPTDKAEITAEHAYQWSHGQAIFASGAPAFSQHVLLHCTE